jgi:hypothetical protein
MILHAASIAAFFVDQLTQAPVQIQCVQQSTPESWLKQWIPTAVSLLSVGIGVWIARWSFRASSERDRERWMLDQKKAEWSRLLESVANINQIVYLGKTMNREIEEGLKNDLKPAIRALSVALANCIFLEDFRPNSENGKKITDFIKSAYITSNKISMRLEMFDSTREKETSSEGNRQDELVNYVNSILDDGFAFAGKTSDLLLWLQEEAAKDLMS